MYPQSASEAAAQRSWGKTAIIAVLCVLLVAALAFGGWAYKKIGDYKNISDAKIAAAAAQAVKVQSQQLQDNFDKQNVKAFRGSATFGSVSFNYPKTWSAYVDSSSSSEPINGYYFPDVVPTVDGSTAFALRVELVDTDYSQVLQQFTSNISEGTVTSRAYVPPKMKNVPNATAGSYMTGQINQSNEAQRGAMVVIKVRDKTLEVYTESSTYLNDFNNIVLASLKFVP